MRRKGFAAKKAVGGEVKRTMSLNDEEYDDDIKRRKMRLWTSDEDAALRALVETMGTKSWTAIAEKLTSKMGTGTRTRSSCENRWNHYLHLGTKRNKEAWTEEEVRIMKQAHSELGDKWSKIAKLLPGRTGGDISNRW